MANYSTFLDVEKLRVFGQFPTKIYRRRVYFGTQALDAGNGDVHRVIPVMAGDVVHDVWVNVATACPENSTINIGHGGIVDYWGRGILIDSVGMAQRVLSTTRTWNAVQLAPNTDQREDISLAGLNYDDLVTVTSSIYLQDLVLHGYVSEDIWDLVTVQMVNNTDEKIDMGAMTLYVSVNKAPLAGTPWLVASADTIDIKATTHRKDVNISSGVIDVYARITRL